MTDTADALDLDGLIQSAAEKYNLDAEHLRAMANTESHGDTQAVSPKGAGGVMQLMPDTARMLGVRNVFDPAENIDAGARYYRSLLDDYKGDETRATAAYNAGPGAVKSWQGVPPYTETKNYLARIHAFKAKRANSSSTPDQPDDVDPASLVSSTPDEPDMPDTPDAAQAQGPNADILATYTQPAAFGPLGLPGPPRPPSGVVSSQQYMQPAIEAVSSAAGVMPYGSMAGPVNTLAGAYQTATAQNLPQAATGITQTLGGALETASPLMLAPMAAPAIVGRAGLPAIRNVAGSLGLGVAAEQGTRRGLEYLGVRPEYAQLGGMVAGIIAGGPLGMKALERAYTSAGSPEVRFGAGKFAEQKPVTEMSDAELRAAWSVNEQDPPKNYNWLREQIAGEVARRQAARSLEPGQQPQQPASNLERTLRERAGVPSDEPPQGGDRGVGPLFEQPQAEQPAGRQSSLSTVVSREPFQPEVLPTDEELQREREAEEKPEGQKPQEPEQPELSEQDQQRSALAQERFGKDYGELTAGERFRVDDELQYRQWGKDFEEAQKGLGEGEPEKQEPEKQEPEEPQDPIVWARGELDAGNDLSVGAIQQKFNLGYLGARQVLQSALAEPKPEGGTIEPRGEPSAGEPELLPPGAGGPLVSEPGGAGGEGPALPGANLPNAEPHRGSQTTVFIPGSDEELPAQYEVAEASDLVPSHHGFSFQPNEKYPFRNERDYTKPEPQMRVDTQSRKFKARWVVNDNPDLVNGPPAIDQNNNAFGGNSRVMTLQRVYAMYKDHAGAYRDYLREQLPRYGINPAIIDTMKEPVLVRRMDKSIDQSRAQELISAMNRAGAAALSPEERAINDSKRVSTDTLDYIIYRIDQAGEGATLASALKGPQGAEIVDRMIQDGLLTTMERPQFVTKDAKGNPVLTPEAERRIQRLMVGRFFDDVSHYDNTPDAIRNKLERMAAPLASLEGRPEWDLISSPLREGLRILREADARGVKNYEDLAAQLDLAGKPAYTNQGVAWAYALKANSARALANAARAYSEMELRSRPGREVDMFGPEPIARNDAYRQAWGDLKAQKGMRLIGGKMPKAPPKAPAVQEEREMSGQRGLFNEPDENGIMNFGPQPGETPAPAAAPKGWSEIEGKEPTLFQPREAEVKREQEANDAALLKARLEAQFKSGMAMRPGRKAAPEETGSLFGPPAAEAPQRGLFEQPATPATPAAPADNAWEQPVHRTTYDDLNRAWVDHPSTPKIINAAEAEIVRRGMLTPDAVRQMRTRVRDLLQSGPAADVPRTAEIYARQLQDYLRGKPSIVNSDRLPDEPHRLPPPEQVQRIPGPTYGGWLSQSELIQQAVAEPAVVGSEHYPAIKMNGQAMHLLWRLVNGKETGIYTKGFLGPPKSGEQIIAGLGKVVNRLRDDSLQAEQDGNPNQAAIYRKQADAIDKLKDVFVQNRKATNGGHVLGYQAGMDRLPENIEGTLKHELDHLVQYRATGADVELHTGLDYYANPETALAAKALRKNSGYAQYSPGQLALEIGARLMQPGAWQQMGLTDAQALAAAKHYIKHLVTKHGINRVRGVIARVYTAIGQPNEYEPQTPDTGTDRGLEAEVAGGGGRPGEGRGRSPGRLPEKDYGDLFGSDPGTRVEQIERPQVSEEIEQQPPEEEKEKQFIEASPKTSGDGRAGPDNGPILGGDLSGGIPPEVLEGLNTVRRTMGERVAGYWTESRENVQRAEENRQRVAAARARGLIPPEELMRGLDLRYWYDAERDAWVVAAIQDVAHAREHTPTKLEQEALTLYRDFKSRPGELRQWQMSNHPSIPLEGGAPPNERIVKGTRNPDLLEKMQKNRAHVLDWIDKNMDMINLALKPTKGMLAADEELTEIAAHTLREGENQNMLKSSIKPPNYNPHMYMEDDPERPLYDNAPVAKGNITSRFEFGEERQHPTMLDGIAHGLTPRSMNAFDLFSIHADKFATARATRMLTRSLSNSPTTPGMWAPSARSARVPDGYVPLGPDTDLFKYITPNGIPLRYFVPHWVAKAMEPVTQPNMLRRQIPGLNFTRTWQARTKEMALSFSLFHVHAMNLEMLNSLSGLNPLSYGTVLKTLGTGMFSQKWMQDPEFQKNERDMVQHGGTTALSGQMIDAYRSLLPEEAASLWDTKVWKQPVINLAPKAARKITNYTFQQVQRYYKVMDYTMKANKWIAEHPDATQREIMQAKRTLGMYVNNVYGGQHAENMGISKATMDVSRALLLAPDWQFANVGQFAQMFQQKGKHWRESYRKGYRKDYWKGTWKNATTGAQHMRGYFLRAGLHAYFGSQLIGHIISGKWNPDPLHHPFDIYLGNDKEGKHIYASVLARGALADFSKLIIGIATRDIGALFGFAVSKGAPGIKEGIELGTGRDWQGRQIVNPNLSWTARNLRWGYHLAPSLMGEPFNVRQVREHMLNQLLPEDERKKETERSFDDVFLSMMGLTQPYRHVVPPGMRMNRLGFLEPRPEKMISSKPAWRQALSDKP